jgi:6-methylsalicylate decarboxylase
MNEQVGTAMTIFSAVILEGKALRELTRKVNKVATTFRDQNPQKYGLFAALLSLLDKEGALVEIAYVLDVLKADGVALFTRYGPGNHYLGHQEFTEIWAELNRHHAVVHIHPTKCHNSTLVSPALPLPILNYPHETTRTAVDMILSNTKRNNPNCKVILSHAGGTLPYLITRVAGLVLSKTFAKTPKTPQEILKDAKTFYYDLALSSLHAVLKMLLDFVLHDHILYGSDFPYSGSPLVLAFTVDLESFPISQELHDMIYFGNAHALLPRLAQS